jgi:hypothetical protein
VVTAGEQRRAGRQRLRRKLLAHLFDNHGVMLTRADSARESLGQLAEMDPCGDAPPLGDADLGFDADGYRVRRSGGTDFRVSDCCAKDATTADDDSDEGTIVCRRCKRPIDEAIALAPLLPYLAPDGHVLVRASTATGY